MACSRWRSHRVCIKHLPLARNTSSTVLHLQLLNCMGYRTPDIVQNMNLQYLHLRYTNLQYSVSCYGRRRRDGEDLHSHLRERAEAVREGPTVGGSGVSPESVGNHDTPLKRGVPSGYSRLQRGPGPLRAVTRERTLKAGGRIARR